MKKQKKEFHYPYCHGHRAFLGDVDSFLYPYGFWSCCKARFSRHHSVPSNHDQMLDFFENAEGSEDSILGYFTVPWTGMSVEYIPAYEESFRQLMEAKKKYIDGKQ